MKNCEKVYIGDSDIASLTARACDEVFKINFGSDNGYSAYLIEGECEIGSHYTLIADVEACWLKIYDDNELSFKSTNYWGKYNKLKIYRAGEMGCIIQFSKL